MSLWFRPACDHLLAKMQIWHDKYEKGSVYSTRDWLSQVGAVEKVPTRYMHKVPFTPTEFKYLVSLMQEMEPKNKLTADLAKIGEAMAARFTGMPLASRPKWLLSGEWIIPLAYYRTDVKEIVDALIRARDNRQSMEEIQKNKKDEGKALFEV